MKKFVIITLVLVAAAMTSKAQTNIRLGGGYFGKTLTYPGVVLDVELEEQVSEKQSMVLRMDLGYFVHKRAFHGLFMDVGYGFRRIFKSGLYLEQLIGVGGLQTFLNADEVYEAGPDGTIKTGNRWGNLDFSPSFQPGVGFHFPGKSSVWIRPKLFWQIPHKTSSAYNVALQVGYSVKL